MIAIIFLLSDAESKSMILYLILLVKKLGNVNIISCIRRILLPKRRKDDVSRGVLEK